MDNATQARLRELTAQIEVEKDQQKFTALVEEFNRLLDGVGQLHPKPTTDRPL